MLIKDYLPPNTPDVEESEYSSTEKYYDREKQLQHNFEALFFEDANHPSYSRKFCSGHHTAAFTDM